MLFLFNGESKDNLLLVHHLKPSIRTGNQLTSLSADELTVNKIA